jgi:selenocysteine lyase/cysteine desulfurase
MRIGEGDEIVISSWSTIQHRALALPPRAPRRGAEMVAGCTMPAPSTSRLRTLFTERTKMVAITHMSNVTGHRGADQGGLPDRP